MTNQEFINSGVLEAYLLGLATKEEEQEVRQRAATHSDVALALTQLEENIEELCMKGAIPPPPDVWQGIQAQISGEVRRYEPPKTPPPRPDNNYVHVEVDDTHIRVHKYWRPAFIAVFILSKIFLVFALYYYFKSNSQDQEIERLKTEIQNPKPSN